jgi:hypothetical protein
MANGSKDETADREESAGGKQNQRSWFDTISLHLGVLAGLVIIRSGVLGLAFKKIAQSVGFDSQKEPESGPASESSSSALSGSSDRTPALTVQAPVISEILAPVRGTLKR